MSQPDPSPENQPKDQAQRSDRADQTQTDFDMLQSLLVEPEVDKLRRQVGEQQQQMVALATKVNALESWRDTALDTMHQRYEQKLSALRQEILTELTPLIDNAIEQQIEPGQTFSIRVSGIEPE